MMIAVLKARFAAEHAQATEATDRGSELGNFDTEEFCIDFDTEDFCIDQLDDEFDMGAEP